MYSTRPRIELIARGGDGSSPGEAGSGDDPLDLGDIRIGGYRAHHRGKLKVSGEASGRLFKAAGATRDREIPDHFGKIRLKDKSFRVEEQHVSIGCGHREGSHRRS